tara:strand:+ start:4719 stop:5366 length:648 start_codon:yes stop_codon:yes gene_type:complete
MSYFKHFNYVNYAFPDGKSRFFKNLSIRLNLQDKVIKQDTRFSSYYIKDGETPDIVSAKTYNKSDYHWCILLANNITNMYTQWPKTSQQLNDFLTNKYKVQRNQAGDKVVLSRLKTLEFVNFTGSPSNNYEDSDGSGVIYRPRHFVDVEENIYSFETASGEYKDAYNRLLVRPTLTPVSYFTHEFNINEKNRTIALPSINLIEQMEKELRILTNE